MIRRVAYSLALGGLLAPPASAQTPAPAASTPPAATAQPAAAAAPAAATTPAARSFSQPLPADPAHPDYHAGAQKSIVRHNPLPRRTSYNAHYNYNSESSSRATPGFSTGGVGRYAEYYDASTPTGSVDLHPQPVARFDSGGGPDRAEQIAAQQNGQVRARNIQSNINAYGTPYGAYGAGFGYGLGLGGGGRLYGYPN